ncbi:hypothetical protein AYI68_g3363, partial [Smittium mucronatum]
MVPSPDDSNCDEYLVFNKGSSKYTGRLHLLRPPLPANTKSKIDGKSQFWERPNSTNLNTLYDNIDKSGLFQYRICDDSTDTGPSFEPRGISSSAAGNRYGRSDGDSRLSKPSVLKRVNHLVDDLEFNCTQTMYSPIHTSSNYVSNEPCSPHKPRPPPTTTTTVPTPYEQEISFYASSAAPLKLYTCQFTQHAAPQGSDLSCKVPLNATKNLTSSYPQQFSPVIKQTYPKVAQSTDDDSDNRPLVQYAKNEVPYESKRRGGRLLSRPTKLWDNDQYHETQESSENGTDECEGDGDDDGSDSSTQQYASARKQLFKNERTIRIKNHGYHAECETFTMKNNPAKINGSERRNQKKSLLSECNKKKSSRTKDPGVIKKKKKQQKKPAKSKPKSDGSSSDTGTQKNPTPAL